MTFECRERGILIICAATGHWKMYPSEKEKAYDKANDTGYEIFMPNWKIDC